MRYLVLATDYDGTIAQHGRVDEPTLEALRRLRATGRKLVLVSGRELEDLFKVFPHEHAALFDRMVLENGALLYRPASREEKLLGNPPPPEFVATLQRRGVHPLSVGRSIVATWKPHEVTVLEAIRDLGLELQVIFNKAAVMVLPSGINKATGLQEALAELGLSPHNVVGIGDAENDFAFLDYCELSAAVANGLPSIRRRADYVCGRDHGGGVIELIDRLHERDLHELAPRLERHQVELGTMEDGTPLRIDPYCHNVLIAGPPGSGKSTLATGLLENLADRGYQFMLVDPEGDFLTIGCAMVLGAAERPPTLEEVVKLLEQPGENVVVNMLAVPLGDRPAFFAALLARIQDLRARTGRPHWLVIDEAHHMVHADLAPSPPALPPETHGLLLITLRPDGLARLALEQVDLLVAVGEAPEQTVASFARALGREPPALRPLVLEQGQMVGWWQDEERPPFCFTGVVPSSERRRHMRKYAVGELGPENHFHFRGPDGRLNLRAQNLMIFLQMAEGVDEATWLHHLRRGEYSEWFRHAINDEELASEAADVEQADGISARESLARIKEAIEQRYTAPA